MTHIKKTWRNVVLHRRMLLLLFFFLFVFFFILFFIFFRVCVLRSNCSPRLWPASAVTLHGEFHLGLLFLVCTVEESTSEGYQ